MDRQAALEALAKGFDRLAATFRSLTASDGLPSRESISEAEKLLGVSSDTLTALMALKKAEDDLQIMDAPSSETARRDDGQYGLFGTSETNEDGLELVEIREPPEPMEPRLVPMPTQKEVTKLPNVANEGGMSQEDIELLEHFRKWEEIEEQEKKKKPNSSTEARENKRQPGLVSVTMHQEAPVATKEENMAEFRIRTPADIHTFMARKPVSAAPNSKDAETTQAKPKAVKFEEELAPGPLPKPSRVSGNAAPTTSTKAKGPMEDAVFEREVEETPTEEDLDAYFDFKEAMQKYREVRPQILGEGIESSTAANALLREISLPQLPGQNEGGSDQTLVAGVGPVVERTQKAVPAQQQAAGGATAKKPSRFKAAMKDKAKP
jgi:hypothetical protein